MEFLLFFLLATAAFIGTIIMAGNKNRNIFLWIILSFLITPFLSFLIILGMDKKMSYDEYKALLKKESTNTNDVEQIQKLFELKEKGIITEEEFIAKKNQLLK